MDKYRIEISLTREMLGTNPASADVMDQHIIAKARRLITQESKLDKAINKYKDAPQITDEKGAEEVELVKRRMLELSGVEVEDLRETVAELDTKGLTIFWKDAATGRPMIGDHMIYGFLKAAAEAIGRTMPRKQGTMLQSVSYTQSIINQHVRCEDRYLVFDQPLVADEEGKTAYLQRSLRAQTAMGPRITLAKSEVVPEGAKLAFTLKVMPNSPLTEKILRTLLDYGEFTGLGAWRNSGYGMFTYTLEVL